jgi:major membrane immunogen (membrane-anchored lipoprotein)
LTINTESISALNDAFRQTFLGGKVLLTCGVNVLPEPAKFELLRKVQDFNGFGENDDPHHEHDFLSVEVEGEKFFAKIDYYDRSMEAGSEDPADPSKTTRVLTIMRADEY